MPQTTVPPESEASEDQTEIDSVKEELNKLSLGEGRPITSSDLQLLQETIKKNLKNTKPLDQKVLLIAHWNIRGIGDHCWDTSALFCLVKVMKVDIILLSEIKSLDLNDLPFISDSFDWICLPPFDGDKKTRGLYIAYRKELSSSILRFNGNDSKTHIHKDKTSFEFLSMDFCLSNGIHRVIIAYHEPNGNEECPAAVKQELENELYPTAADNSPAFVHVLGDLNFPDKTNRAKLTELLGVQYKKLLHDSWATHRENQLDLMFSCGPDDNNLKTSVYAHFPVHPYEDLVKKIGTLEVDSSKMSMLTIDGVVSVKLMIKDKTCPKSAIMKKEPDDIHKILLLHIGDQIRHINAPNCYHCSAKTSPCFYYVKKSKEMKWHSNWHTKFEIDNISSRNQ